MRKRKILFRITIMLMGAVLLLFSGTNAPGAAPEGTLKVALHFSLGADWLDPATNIGGNSTSAVLYLFHDALLKIMPDGLYSPGVAESWKISPDYKVYEFNLRKGVKFHNGDPVTAEDVVFSFQRYKSALSKSIHDKTEKIEAVNPHLVRITFKESYVDFLQDLLIGGSAIAWVVPKKYVEKVGDAGFRKHPIGCGPYKFVEFSAGSKLIAEAFPEYWRKVPNIKRLEIYIVPEPATRLVMVRRGEADIATNMQKIFYEDAKKDPNLRVLAPASSTRWIVYMASQWDPKSPWSNPKVRKAASLAIDRKTLADIFMPGCSGIGALAFENDPHGITFPPDPYDPEKAKKLLAEAGYPDGVHGGTFYPWGSYWEYGEQIANYWKAIGITVDLRLVDRPAYLAQRRGGKWKDALFIDWTIAPSIGTDIGYLFGATSYGNYPDIEKLWNQYKKSIDMEERKKLIIQIQKMIHEKTMFILLTAANSPGVVGPRVKGNPWKIQPPKTFPIWFLSPYEDIELNK